MSRKTFVIDTNVFLHDPFAINKFKDNDVVIPLVVLEEISGLKRQVGELGNNARTVMRMKPGCCPMMSGCRMRTHSRLPTAVF